MRIGIYAPNMATSAPSGVERYIVELLRALARRPSAHEVALITDSPDLPLPAGGRRVSVRSMGRAARLWFDHCRLARVAREEKLDLLHCAKSFVPSGLDCPSVATVYDVIFLKRGELYPFWWKAYWTRALRASMERATAVVAISEFTARDVETLLPAARGKVQAVRSGVNPSAFASTDDEARKRREAKGVPTSYFLCVGNLTRRKNLPVLLDAFASVREATGAALVVAGALDYGADELMRRFQEPGVTYLGRVDDALLAALYRGALAFVYPSSEEGFGLPVLEAMASGAPVIATTGGALPEAVGDAGLLVAPGSVAELAQAMRRIAAEPALRSDVVTKGTRRVAEHSWDRTAEETVRVYEKAAARR
ncbi:MAG: glycosyltransferase family 4 protein [Planctomycetaceae bacterium]|nr:glycosyltransferase family 4 protein [Planctomycetaceae bacterium]